MFVCNEPCQERIWRFPLPVRWGLPVQFPKPEGSMAKGHRMVLAGIPIHGFSAQPQCPKATFGCMTVNGVPQAKFACDVGKKWTHLRDLPLTVCIIPVLFTYIRFGLFKHFTFRSFMANEKTISPWKRMKINSKLQVMRNITTGDENPWYGTNDPSCFLPYLKDYPRSVCSAIATIEIPFPPRTSSIKASYPYEWRKASCAILCFSLSYCLMCPFLLFLVIRRTPKVMTIHTI